MKILNYSQWLRSRAQKVFLVMAIMPACSMISLKLNAQMESVVNSLADDEMAYPYDNPATMDIDESMDGICNDEGGRCTLRAAIGEAYNLNTSARITFSVMGTIAIYNDQGAFYPPDDSWIQSIDQKVTIFGSGPATPALLIVGNNTLISGLQFTNALMGIIVEGNNNRIGLDHLASANYISDMTQNGIIITGDSNNITGNVIGLDILGNPEKNAFGVIVFGNNNVIGGIKPGEGNVISGNDKGILVNVIENNHVAYIVGNQIGTNIAGTAAIGNKIGIEITGPNAVVGGNNSAAMNVISGNTESGVLTGLFASNILILGNHVGVDKTGNVNIPNRDGIALGPGSKDCLVENNLIKSNTQFGIYSSGLMQDSLESVGHVIVDNEILMNTIAGIGISNNSTFITVGESILGPGTGNVIQFNGQGGVVFSNSLGTPKNNTIRKNSFRQNGTKGIDIATHCSNCQDQTFPPDITSYTEVDAVTALVVGTHHDAGSIIDVYTGDINLSGRYEGRVWLGSATVDANHDFILAIDNCQCDIVATATDPDKNTSEFTDGEALMTALDDLPDIGVSIKTYPNPFKQEVTIQFTLRNAEKIQLYIYDMLGNNIETLLSTHLQAGEHEATWIPDDLPKGMYYYQLDLGSYASTTGKVAYLE